MEKVLWYLLTGMRGGENRARVIRSISERPKNANQLSEELELDYNTVRYHLDMLCEHGVLEEGEGGYGQMYFLTDRFEQNRDTFEKITEKMD